MGSILQSAHPKRPVSGSLWKHYRTGKVYRILDSALFVTRDADRWHVVYEPVEKGDGPRMFVRTYEDFFQLVSSDGMLDVHRFSPVEAP